MKRKWISVLLALLCIVTIFTACDGDPTEETEPSGDGGVQTENTDLTLPYLEADSLNPFFAVSTENTALGELCYEPLFRITASYTAEPALASSYKNEGAILIVTLHDRVFSNGRAVTAEDVVYSFNKARTAQRYAKVLSCFASARASNSKTISFFLVAEDKYAVNLLHFPIVQKDTAEDKDKMPVGSGAYQPSDKILVKNPRSAVAAKQAQIKLFPISDAKYEVNALEIGNLSCMLTDFSNGTGQRVSANTKNVPLNSMVYLGINCWNGALSSAAVRTAISNAIDSEEVVSASYQGYALPASTPFNPLWAETKGVKGRSTKGDTARAKSILERVGYNRFNAKGVRTNGTYALSYTLLVNSDNSFRTAAAQKIAKALNDAGFTVTVKAVPYAQYVSLVNSSSFDLYLGEIKLTENMNLNPFLVGGEVAAKGVNASSEVCLQYRSFKAGQTDMSAFMEQFLTDMPFVPICYREGMFAYREGFSGEFPYAYCNLYAALCA